MARNGEARIGTSGYHYDHWRGVFYPESLPKRQWFSFYAAHFDTVEINNTFYRLPTAKTFDAWRKQTPAGFCYAVKFSRYGSHVKRLKAPRGTLGRFLRRVDHLGEFLGPILVQLPPRWDVNVERLAKFLAAAPRTRRWAVEFRDARWLCEEVYAVLKQYRAALCIHDMIEEHPRTLTADWVYLRFHGNRYQGNYSAEALRVWAQRISEYRKSGLDVFAFFNNDQGGHAIHNAADLKRWVLKKSDY
jgi:uncharacterized protein YecE (DUF72 family)